MDRGAWQATVHGVAKGRTGLKRCTTLSTLELLIYTLCVKKTETKTWVNVLHCLTHFPNKSANFPVFQDECLSPFSPCHLNQKLSIIFHSSLSLRGNKQTKNAAYKVSTHGTRVQFISSNSLVNGS